MKKQILLILVLALISSSDVFSQRRNKKKSKKGQVTTSAPAPKAKKNGVKPYGKVITKDAVTDDGLFKVHRIGEKYYYEIPNAQLEKEMLWVSRISQIPANLGGGFRNAGSKVNEQVVSWNRFQNKILLKTKSYNAVADESLPISVSVKANNYEPTIAAFKIEAFNADSTAVVIDVTKLFSTDVRAISGLSNGLRTSYRVRNLDASRSFINSIKSFPENIEVKQDFTYNATNPPSARATGSISLQMNQSMILLPEKPMQPRIFDRRVGFFTISQVDYGSEKLKADRKEYIRRWRLEPKDPAAYARGELVEPVKPIVYYLDPATPEKLRKYIKQGIEDWQKPFETAGFKNAIIAKDPPSKEEDPEFSPEDIRYSVVRYVASETRNAVGPSVSDPRSGEIIESDIIWYHNHLRSYRNRYLLETGAANPSARTLATPAEKIGAMMRMVIAHEVGHALGFPHNMAASFAYDVESYRDGDFTQEHGLAASLMDYTRYNYIAQPGDKNIRFIRKMGPYDHYATNWGYRVIPNAKTPEDELSTLNKWITDKADDPRYKFGQQRGPALDPSSQTESIGDNPIEASDYGIKNLKYVAKNLPAWTSDVTNNYDDLEELYRELLGVWNRYVGHVITNIGGVYEDYKTPAQNGVVYTHVDEATQKASMKWVQDNVFKTPTWLIDKKILQNIDHAGYFERLRSLQVRQLNTILRVDRIGRLIDAETINDSYYSALEMFRDLRNGIWSELRTNTKVDIYRRDLQRAYIERMSFLMEAEQQRVFNRPGLDSPLSYNVNQSDVDALVRGELKQLRRRLLNAKNSASNTITRYHYEDCIARIDAIFDNKS